jgi:hypothetical protein
MLKALGLIFITTNMFVGMIVIKFSMIRRWGVGREELQL